MYPRVIVLASCVILLVGCGSDSTSPAVAPSASSTVAAPGGTVAPPTTARPSPEGTSTSIPPDFTRFIAAVDAALDETSYAGAAISDPEVFIATGQLFCELLEEGLSFDDILVEHLDALAAVSVGELTEADGVATGVVLGVSTEVICPQHQDRS